MELAETDLAKIIKNKQMNFREFFELFKDSIIGLTYMHINKIAHRDIKPQNIMRLGKNKYVLADYGVGTNLTYFEIYHKGDDY